MGAVSKQDKSGKPKDNRGGYWNMESFYFRFIYRLYANHRDKTQAHNGTVSPMDGKRANHTKSFQQSAFCSEWNFSVCSLK